MSARDWTRSPGPKSSRRWVNSRTGEIDYSDENPGGKDRDSQPDTGNTDRRPGSAKPNAPGGPKKPAGPQKSARGDNDSLSHATMEYVRAKPGGANAGGVFRDHDGSEWLIKQGASDDHARNEVLASRLYKLAGIATPDIRLFTGADGKQSVASKWMPNIKNRPEDAIANAHKAYAGFATDAWLANWDVAGSGQDNLFVTDHGDVLRGDIGGALRYRATGGAKGEKFGSEVSEIKGFRDAKKNAGANNIFKGMTDDDIEASVANVLKIRDEDVRAAVSRYGPEDEAERTKLADTLIARKKNLASQFPGAAKRVPKEQKPKRTPEEAAADYKQNGTRAAAFKEWFGDWESGDPDSSRVIDPATGHPSEQHSFNGRGSVVTGADGAPIVVYHGSAAKFEAFNPEKAGSGVCGKGFYFTGDKSRADNYNPSAIDPSVSGGETYATYLNIRKPFDMDRKYSPAEYEAITGRKWGVWKKITRALGSGGEGGGARPADHASGWEIYNELAAQLSKGRLGGDRDAANRHLRSAGFDGLTHTYGEEGGERIPKGPKNTATDYDPGTGNRIWVAFDPTQVKSVHNRGTFDPNDKRMTFAEETGLVFRNHRWRREDGHTTPQIHARGQAAHYKQRRQPTVAKSAMKAAVGLMSAGNNWNERSKAFVDAQVKKLPPVAEKAVRSVWAVYGASFTAAQAAVVKVAAAKGLSPDRIETISKYVAAADWVVAKIVGWSGSAVGLGSLTKTVGGFVPMGSLAYLAVSTVTHPVTTLRAIAAAVAGVAIGAAATQMPGVKDVLDNAFSEDAADGGSFREEFAEWLVSLDEADVDLAFGAFLVAMDKTDGDCEKSLEIASSVVDSHGAKKNDAESLDDSDSNDTGSDDTEPQTYAESDWHHDPTKRTNNRWKNVKTGTIKYQATNPGVSKRKPAAKKTKPVAEKTAAVRRQSPYEIANFVNNPMKLPENAIIPIGGDKGYFFAGAVDLRLKFAHADGSMLTDAEAQKIKTASSFGGAFGDKEAEKLGTVKRRYKTKDEAEKALADLQAFYAKPAPAPVAAPPYERTTPAAGHPDRERLANEKIALEIKYTEHQENIKTLEKEQRRLKHGSPKWTWNQEAQNLNKSKAWSINTEIGKLKDQMHLAVVEDKANEGDDIVRLATVGLAHSIRGNQEPSKAAYDTIRTHMAGILKNEHGLSDDLATSISGDVANSLVNYPLSNIYRDYKGVLEQKAKDHKATAAADKIAADIEKEFGFIATHERNSIKHAFQNTSMTAERRDEEIQRIRDRVKAQKEANEAKQAEVDAKMKAEAFKSDLSHHPVSKQGTKQLISDMFKGTSMFPAVTEHGYATNGKYAIKLTDDEKAKIVAHVETRPELKGSRAPNVPMVIEDATKKKGDAAKVVGVRERDVSPHPEYLLQTDAGHQEVVDAKYHRMIMDRYPDATTNISQTPGHPVVYQVGGKTVGLVMPLTTSNRGSKHKPHENQIDTVEFKKPEPTSEDKLARHANGRAAKAAYTAKGGTMGNPTTAEVSGHRYGDHFGVHKDADGDYVVTHIPSGLVAGGWKRKKDAAIVAMAMGAKGEWSETDPKRIPKESIAHAKAVNEMMKAGGYDQLIELMPDAKNVATFAESDDHGDLFSPRDAEHDDDQDHDDDTGEPTQTKPPVWPF